MEYNGTVYRPPMEADTFLIPVTEGCCAHSSNMDMTFFKSCSSLEVPRASVVSNTQPSR